MKGCPRRRGYTLVELLLVVTIFVLIAGLAVPMFVSSFAGAKLRTSVRSVVMAHRYARNMAVLRQRPVAVVVNKEQNSLEIVFLTGRESESLSELAAAIADDDGNGVPDSMSATPTDSSAVMTNAEGQAVEDKAATDMLRVLESGVVIDNFETQRPTSDDPHVPPAVLYYPSGLCDGFTMRLVDDHGHTVELTADQLTGQLDVRYPDQ